MKNAFIVFQKSRKINKYSNKKIQNSSWVRIFVTREIFLNFGDVNLRKKTKELVHFEVLRYVFIFYTSNKFLYDLTGTRTITGYDPIMFSLCRHLK